MPAPDTIPPDILRDTFVIWIYATVSRLPDILTDAQTSQSPIEQLRDQWRDELLSQLMHDGSITPHNPANKHTMQEAVQAVLVHGDELSQASCSLKGLTALSGAPWSGQGPHPSGAELQSMFIAPE